ncbi:unnamed protein product [Cunninghamella echinulata]
MKFISNLASLSTAATLLLQIGLIFTLPGKEDTQIENNTKHAVAWTIPEALEGSVLSLSLVKADDTSKSINIKILLVGSTGEIPIDIGNYEPGKYYYHLQTNDINGCSIDSHPITINKQQTTPPSPPSDNINHADAELLNELNNSIPSTSTFASNDHFNELIDKLDNIEEEDQPSNEFDAIIDQFAETPVETEQKYANNDNDEYDALISEMPVEDENLENEDNDEFNAMIQNYAEEDQVKESKQDKELHVNLGDVFENFQKLIDNQKQHKDADSINKILDGINDSSSSHNNDVNKDEQHKLESFDEFIASLDQDYAQYIKNNKESKPDNTMHKNSDDLNVDESQTNAKFFTNEDRTHHKSNAKRDDRISHTDAAPVDDNKQPVWYTAPYFTNDYQVTSGHNDDADALSWKEDIDVKPHVDHNDAEPANVEWEQENGNEAGLQWSQDHVDANIDEDFAFYGEDNGHADDASVAWSTPEDIQDNYDDNKWSVDHVDANINEDFSFTTNQANVGWAEDESESNWIVPEQQQQQHKNDVNEDEVNEWSEEDLVLANGNEAGLQWSQDHVDANIDEDFAFYGEDNDHADDASVAWSTPEDHYNDNEWSVNHVDANIDEDFSFNPAQDNDEWEQENDNGVDGKWSVNHVDANIDEDFAFYAEDNGHADDASVAWSTPEDHYNDNEWSVNHVDANINEDFSFTTDQANVGWAEDESESNWIVPEQQQQQQQQQQHNDEDVIYTNADDHWNSEENNAYSDWTVPENEEEETLQNEPAHVDDDSWTSNTIDELEHLNHEDERLALQTDVIEHLDSTDSLHWDSDSIEVGNDDEIEHVDHIDDGQWHDAEEFLEQHLSWASDSVFDDDDDEETNVADPIFSENQALHADVAWLYDNSNEDESHDDAAVEWQEDNDDVEALHANVEWSSNEHLDDSSEVYDDDEWQDAEDDTPTAQSLSWATDSVMADDDFTFQENSEWNTNDHSNVDDAFFAESGWEED